MTSRSSYFHAYIEFALLSDTRVGQDDFVLSVVAPLKTDINMRNK